MAAIETTEKVVARLQVRQDCVGVPIGLRGVRPFLENALDSKLNPLVALGRNGSLGLSGFVNKFNADAELLDDLVRLAAFLWVSIGPGPD